MADGPSRDGPSSSPVFDDVPRETMDRLAVYAAELKRWQGITNLVGPRTLTEIWSRHFADSLQLLPLAEGRVWADLGSGAGFPGLVVAIADPSRTVHLVESDSRRCAFLRHVARLTGADVRVWDGRIEAVASKLDPRPAVVTARAVAPLSRLLAWSEELWNPGTTALFPKGRDVERELTDAGLSWTFTVDIVRSRIESDSSVLRIRDLVRRLTRPDVTQAFPTKSSDKQA